jgi:myo-inositol 2-dehydrogenase/D-chiro-inositol 1-dehydrogenase
MRIGLAGAGRIGARHAETLRNLPEVESVVIADVDAERARALAGKHGAQAADTTGSSWPPRPTPTRSW